MINAQLFLVTTRNSIQKSRKLTTNIHFVGILFVLFAFFLSPLEAADDSRVPLVIETGEGATKVSHSVDVELALTREARALGLMYRKSMDSNHGMLFIFSNSRRVSFWMRNTYLPLDIIYIRSTGRIANILHDVPPLNELPRPSEGRVIAVLELNAGEAARRGIKAGDYVRIPKTLMRRAK